MDAGLPHMTRDPLREEDSDVATESRTEVKRPPLYKVLLHNDDYTTQDFVVYILQVIFDHPAEAATQIMLHVHRRGIGIAGLFP